MTTTYTGIPTFEERVVASTLVVLGRVEKIIDTTIDYRQEQPQVRTTFRVNIESILKGKIASSTIDVQVAGGKAEKAETPWSVRLKEGKLALLFLAPNYANRAPDVFVPYFGSSYQVTTDGNVELSEEVAKQLASQDIPIRRGRAKLADLRRLIKKVVRRQERDETLLAEQEPDELRKVPYREIQEMPQASLGGARSSAPDGRAEQGQKAD